MIYRFRAILDTQEDVFRDIEIEASNTMEDFHNAITQAFGFAGQEMASFYVSNELWEQGEEIALFDMSEGGDTVRTMHDTILEDTVWDKQPRLLYVYDFLNMWTFMVELAEITEPTPGVSYPNLMFSHGQIPDEAPEKEFIAERTDGEDDFDDDEYDLDAEDYDNLDFDENWN
ncbi:plasmid pRiA4b ORF-3 family protein [Rasiella rasia]|uniref:Plasmid pRiA4b ORF-3 family protein n=1 Tax=Rasiella rasia TaxID=2744027 RepID=A0A6G6GK65_9FLAO|nr:plasmid pRiA4b ORF-3 family protein [Rasiella rasia]QIE58938.1 plasmid pRiA4b ORF-3 family protein [Rasiella rasia]